MLNETWRNIIGFFILFLGILGTMLPFVPGFILILISFKFFSSNSFVTKIKEALIKKIPFIKTKTQ